MSARLKISLMIVSAMAIVAIAPFAGLTFIDPASLLIEGHPDAEVFWRLRLPRTMGSFFAGAALSMGGLIFQALFRNPLATPFTLGVSSGASLGASVFFWLGGGMAMVRSAGIGPLLSALTGAGLSMVLVWSITRSKGGVSTAVMLLAGVVVNFFFSSLVLFVQYLGDARDSLRIMRWLMGSLAGLETARLADLGFVTLFGGLVIMALAPQMDLLTAGEEMAASRGVRLKTLKLAIFVTASVMVGTVVSMAGPIGFVGLMVPHACRLMLGWSHRRLTPAVLFSGGAFLVLCDLASRLVLAPAEVPVGIITALLGGPFFLWILFRTGGAGDLF